MLRRGRKRKEGRKRFFEKKRSCMGATGTCSEREPRNLELLKMWTKGEWTEFQKGSMEDT